MSPEFNFQLKITADSIQEAAALQEFLLRIRGIEEIIPLDQFRVRTIQGQLSMQSFIDLATPLGEVVRLWREERGLKASELVKLSGLPLTKGYLSELEHGRIQRPGKKHLDSLAKALSISTEDILNHKVPSKENVSQETNLE